MLRFLNNNNLQIHPPLRSNLQCPLEHLKPTSHITGNLPLQLWPFGQDQLQHAKHLLSFFRKFRHEHAGPVNWPTHAATCCVPSSIETAFGNLLPISLSTSPSSLGTTPLEYPHPLQLVPKHSPSLPDLQHFLFSKLYLRTNSCAS